MSSPAAPSTNLPAEGVEGVADAVAVSDEPQTLPEYETLVSSLRASLASTHTLLQTQSDRLMQLSDLETELASLKDQNTFISAAKEAVELQLKDEVKRREMAEENVELLRGQVEQARRGVMVLQKQDMDRKRGSLLPGAGSGVGGLGLVPGEGDEAVGESQGPAKLSKRQSILAGRGHGRVGSQSEPGESSHGTSPSSEFKATTTKGGLRELRLGSSSVTTPPAASTSPSAQSGFFDESAAMSIPSTSGGAEAPPLPKRHSASGLPASPKDKSDQAAKEEAARLRADVQALQRRLDESEEARIASESALKALREFITAGAGDSAGDSAASRVDDMMKRGSMTESMVDLLKGIRLPPLPTDREVDEHTEGGGGLTPGDRREEKKMWGFKLFAGRAGLGPASPTPSTAVEPPATPHLSLSPDLSSKRSSGTTPMMSPLPPSGELPTESNVSAVPPSSTPLGNFVSGWTKGIASPAASTPAPPLTTRKLSSFFSRKRASTADTGSAEHDKELPPPPADGMDVVDLTEEGGQSAHGPAEIEVTLHAPAQAEGLEPSPEIAEKRAEDKVATEAEIPPAESSNNTEQEQEAEQEQETEVETQTEQETEQETEQDQEQEQETDQETEQEQETETEQKQETEVEVSEALVQNNVEQPKPEEGAAPVDATTNEEA